MISKAKPSKWASNIEVEKIRAGTIFFTNPLGESIEHTIFGTELDKLVKSLVNFATFLQLNGYTVSGSMVEEIDKYWESTTDDLKGVPNGQKIH